MLARRLGPHTHKSNLIVAASQVRYGRGFWGRTTRLGFKASSIKREYCEAYGVPLKAFGNWRAKFKAEPQTPARKVLYRHGGLSHTLSHGLSHGLSHDLPTGPTSRRGVNMPLTAPCLGCTRLPPGGNKRTSC